jgi:Asp/Glu/hydantoin racemase
MTSVENVRADSQETTRILWVNPLYTDAYDAPLARSFAAIVNPSTSVDVMSFKGAGTSHVEYNSYETLMGPELLRTVRWAEEVGYDALVIGCFYDPFLRAARELATRLVVTAPAQACLSLASSLGESFSILVGRQKWIPEMRENVHRYGMADKLASWRVLGMGVDDFQADPQRTESLMMAEAEAAVTEDGADVVILGCTAEFGFYQHVQAKLGVPVIDATVAPLKYAEFLVELRQRFGWAHSKLIGYEGPLRTEADKFIPAQAPIGLVSAASEGALSR